MSWGTGRLTDVRRLFCTFYEDIDGQNLHSCRNPMLSVPLSNIVGDGRGRTDGRMEVALRGVH